MALKSKYNFSNQCYNDIIKLIIDLIPSKHNKSKDLYQSKKILASLGMNYEKIDVCEKNCMLFWKEHKDNIEYMHCGRSQYVNVVNEDGVSVTTKLAAKQLHYMPITPRLKQLFLSEERVKQMRWHKEWQHDSKDSDIMSHHADDETWQALKHFYLEFARDLGVFVLVCRLMVLNHTVPIVARILAGQFLSCPTISLLTMFETRVYIPSTCHSGS
jgi:hypothetical protein